MISRLVELLDVPLRDRNTLLLAAGYAPMFRQAAMDELKAAKMAMERVLHAHKPLPAFVVDRHWNVVLSNKALPQLYEGCSEALMRPPVNAMRLMLNPAGMGPRIINYGAWRAYSLSLLRRQIENSADAVLESLLVEVAAYPVPFGQDPQDGFDRTEHLATPLRLHTRMGAMSFLNTITIFGTANDITLAELALEMLFPADDQTVEIIANLADEAATRG